jgi:GT2 family glycosyltransferase/glycosyltransferase involved in cell wall biosynthesis
LIFQKIKKIIRLVNLLYENPRLIFKFISEIQNHGIKYSLQRVKNKINKNLILPYNTKYNNFFGQLSHEPLVSIISVNYNGAKDLIDYFETLLCQSYKNFELIIIDNNSIDNSLDIIKSYQNQFEQPFLLIESNENLGFAEGNNVAYESASGEFIALLNVDTKVDKEWLYELVEAYRFDPQVSAVTSKIIFWEKFYDLTLVGTSDFCIDLKTLIQSMHYEKYFIREGQIENNLIYSHKNRIRISLAETSQLFNMGCSSFNKHNIIDIFVGIFGQTHYKTVQMFEEKILINLDFTKHYFGKSFIINNAGSIVKNQMPADRGFGEYDVGQYDSKCYVPYFCGCSVLIRRAAIIERKIFISELFAYYEDSELSQWMLNQKYTILYAPRSIVYHKHSATSKEGSILWQFLVKRSCTIYSSSSANKLEKDLLNIQSEFKNKGIPSNVAKKLEILDKKLIHRLSDGESKYEKTKAIGIYNSYWNTKGGGESHTLSIAAELKKYFPVYLISESDFNIEELGSYFHIDLQGCKKLVVSHINTELTQKFYLFINATYGSNLVSRAQNSWYILYFPHKNIHKTFLESYYFLFICEYVQKWANKYWGMNRLKGQIFYPLGMLNTEKISTDNKPKLQKELIILSVGRFFTGHHCKNQLEIAMAYKSLVEQYSHLSTWKLVFAGSLNTSNKDHVAYLQEVQEVLIGHNVEFYINASKEQLNLLYGQACLYIHASGLGRDPDKEPEKFEHFGITPIEAMLSGCIPIVYSVGGPSDTIDRIGFGKKFDSEKSLVAAMHDYTLLLLPELTLLSDKITNATKNYLSNNKIDIMISSLISTLDKKGNN